MTLDVQSTDLMESVKAQVQALEGIPVGEQRLIFAGKQLNDGLSLQGLASVASFIFAVLCVWYAFFTLFTDYAVPKDATLELTLRLKGGIKVFFSFFLSFFFFFLSQYFCLSFSFSETHFFHKWVCFLFSILFFFFFFF
jgi:hypothetical protein